MLESNGVARGFLPRNLGNATTTNSQGSSTPFADGTPNLLDYAYAGRRIMVGLNFRTL